MYFKDLIGNEKVKKVLNRIIEQEKISHSYMFVGTEGVGKFLFAKEFAKQILCMEKDKDNTCTSCIEFDSGNHPDFHIIEPDGNAIKIEQIRLLTNKILEKPITSNKKVYILNDADKMTKEAANCLLKTLEEPPEYIVIILIGQNENLFLNTIKSRCTKIHFQEIEKQELKRILREKYEFTDITDNMIDAMQGSLKKAIDFKEKNDIYKLVENIFLNLETINIIDLLKKKDLFSQNKEEIFSILEYITQLFFSKISKNKNYIYCIEIVEKTKNRIKLNSNFDMSIDELLISVWEEINEKHNRSSI